MSDSNGLQRVVVGLVIVRDRAALVLQRSTTEDVLPGLWELPSGKKEFGESCQEAALREAYEETHLRIRLGEPCHVFDYVLDKAGQGARDTTQISFLATTIGDDEPRLSSEHQALAWVGPAELGSVEMSDHTRAAIRTGLAKMTAD